MALTAGPLADFETLGFQDDGDFTSEPFDIIDNNLFSSGDDSTLREILDIQLTADDEFEVPKEKIETPNSMDILKETIKKLQHIPAPPPPGGDDFREAAFVMEPMFLKRLKSSQAAQQKYYQVQKNIERAVTRAKLAKLSDTTVEVRTKLLAKTAMVVGSTLAVVCAVYFGAPVFIDYLFASGYIQIPLVQNFLISLIEKSFYTNFSLLTTFRQNFTELSTIDATVYKNLWRTIQEYLQANEKKLLYLTEADWTSIKEKSENPELHEKFEILKKIQLQIVSMILTKQDLSEVDKKLHEIINSLKEAQDSGNFNLELLGNLGELTTPLYTLIGKSNFIFQTATALFKCISGDTAKKIQKLLLKTPINILTESSFIKQSSYDLALENINSFLDTGLFKGINFHIAFPIQYELFPPEYVPKPGEKPPEAKIFWGITGTQLRQNAAQMLVQTAFSQTDAVVDMAIDTLIGQIKEVDDNTSPPPPDDEDPNEPIRKRIQELQLQKKSDTEIQEILEKEFTKPPPPEDLTIYPTDSFMEKITKELKQGIKNITEVYKKTNGFWLTTSLSAFIMLITGFVFDTATKPSSFSKDYLLGRMRFYLFPLLSIIRNIVDYKIFRRIPTVINPFITELTALVNTLIKECIQLVFDTIGEVGSQLMNGLEFVGEKLGLSRKSLLLKYARTVLTTGGNIILRIGSFLTTTFSKLFLTVGLSNEMRLLTQRVSFIMRDISLTSIYEYLNTYNGFMGTFVRKSLKAFGGTFLKLPVSTLTAFGQSILKNSENLTMPSDVTVLEEYDDTNCLDSDYAEQEFPYFNYFNFTEKKVGQAIGIAASFLNPIISTLFGVPPATNIVEKCHKAKKVLFNFGTNVVIPITDKELVDKFSKKVKLTHAIHNIYFVALAMGINPKGLEENDAFEEIVNARGDTLDSELSLDTLKKAYRNAYASSNMSNLKEAMFTTFKNAVFKQWKSKLEIGINLASKTEWKRKNPEKTNEDYIMMLFETTFPELKAFNILTKLDPYDDKYQLEPSVREEIQSAMFQHIGASVSKELRAFFFKEFKNATNFQQPIVFQYEVEEEEKEEKEEEEEEEEEEGEEEVKADKKIVSKKLVISRKELPGLEKVNPKTVTGDFKDQSDELQMLEDLGYFIYVTDVKDIDAQITAAYQLPKEETIGVNIHHIDIGASTEFIKNFFDHINSNAANSKLKILNKDYNAGEIKLLYEGLEKREVKVYIDVDGQASLIPIFNSATDLEFSSEELQAAIQWFSDEFIEESKREEFLSSITGMPVLLRNIAEVGRVRRRADKAIIATRRLLHRNKYRNIVGALDGMNLNGILPIAGKEIKDFRRSDVLFLRLLGESSLVRVPTSTLATDPKSYDYWIRKMYNSLNTRDDKVAALWYILLSGDPTFQEKINTIYESSSLFGISLQSNTAFLTDSTFSAIKSCLLSKDSVPTRDKRIQQVCQHIQEYKQKLLDTPLYDSDNVVRVPPYVAQNLEKSTVPLQILSTNPLLETFYGFEFILHYFESLKKDIDNENYPDALAADPGTFMERYFGLGNQKQVLFNGEAPDKSYQAILQGMIDATGGQEVEFPVFISQKCKGTMKKFNEERTQFKTGTQDKDVLDNVKVSMKTWLPRLISCMRELITELHSENLKKALDVTDRIDNYNKMYDWITLEWKEDPNRTEMSIEEIEAQWEELGQIPPSIRDPLSRERLDYDIVVKQFSDYTQAYSEKFANQIKNDILKTLRMKFPEKEKFFNTSRTEGAPRGTEAPSAGTKKAGVRGGIAGEAAAGAAEGKGEGEAQQTKQSTTEKTIPAQAKKEDFKQQTEQDMERDVNSLASIFNEALSNMLALAQALLELLGGFSNQLASAFGGKPQTPGVPGSGMREGLVGLGTGRAEEKLAETPEDVEEQCYKYAKKYIITGNKVKITDRNGLPPFITEDFLANCTKISTSPGMFSYILSIYRTILTFPLTIIQWIESTKYLNNFPNVQLIAKAIKFTVGGLFTLLVSKFNLFDKEMGERIQKLKKKYNEKHSAYNTTGAFDAKAYFSQPLSSNKSEQEELLQDMADYMTAITFLQVVEQLESIVNILTLGGFDLGGLIFSSLKPPTQITQALYGSDAGKYEFNVQGRYKPLNQADKMAGYAFEQARLVPYMRAGLSLASDLTMFFPDLLQVFRLNFEPIMKRVKSIYTSIGTVLSSFVGESLWGDYKSEGRFFTYTYGEEGTGLQDQNPWHIMGTFLKRVSKESTFESIKNAPQSYLTTQFISTYTEFLIKPMEEYLKEAYDNFWCEPLLYFCLPNTYTFNVTIKTNKLQKNGSVQSMPDDVIHLPLLLTKKPTILELNTALQRELEKNAKETFPPMYAIFSESNTSLKTEYSNWEKTTLGACTLRNACTDLVNQKPIEVTFEVTYPAPPEEETVEENLEEEVPEPEKTHTTASIGLLKGGTRWGAMLNWMKTKNGLSLLKFIKAQSKEQKNNFLLPLPALQSGNALEGIEDDRDPNNYTFEYLELATQEPDAKTEEERNTIQKLWKLPSHISHSNFKSMIQTIFGLSFNETTLYPPFIMISDDVFKDTEGTPLRTLIDTNYLTFENINVVTQCGKFYNWNNTEEKKTVRILKRDFEAFKTLSNSTGTDQAIAQSFINGYYNKVINDSCRQVSKYEIKDSEWFNYILLFSSMVGHPKYRVQENTYEEEKEDGEVKRTTTNTLIFDFITLGQPEGVEEGDVYTISNVEDLPESTEQPLQFFRNISEKRTISKAK